HAEVLRVDLIFAHLPVLQFANQGGGSQRAFIHAVLAVDDQHVTGPQPLQDAHLDADQVGVEDAHELVGGIGGVGQRAQDVEDGPHPQFFAHGSDVLHGTVVGGGEHEADADLFDAFGHLLGRQIDVHAQGLEHVGAAGRGRGAAVAMLGDLHASCCGNEHGGGGNVEGVGSVSTGAAHVEQVVGVAHG